MAEESTLERALLHGGARGLAGALFGGGGRGALLGGAMGAGTQGLGTAMLGDPREGAGFGEEFKRGALGGAATGALVGPVALGTQPGGGALLKALIQQGMSKNKALAVLMGTGLLGGSASGALSGGIESGIGFGLD